MKLATNHRAILFSSNRTAAVPTNSNRTAAVVRNEPSRSAQEDARAQVRLLITLLALTLFTLLTSALRASLVTGNVVDVGLAALQTKMMFTPTNSVLVTGGGLSAGPAKTITTTNGAFSQVLDAGDYVVSFPLVPWRKSFVISVPAGQTNNITNWISSAIGPYTNTLADDAGTTILFNP